MDMIFGPPDCERSEMILARDTANKWPKALLQFWANEFQAPFRAEHAMKKIADESMWHEPLYGDFSRPYGTEFLSLPTTGL